MKKLAQFCAIALISGFFVACNSEVKPADKVEFNQNPNSETRGLKRVKFQGESFNMVAADIIVAKQAANNQQQDAEAVKAIFNSLQAAEKKAQALDIQVILSEETIQDGMFVFALETENSKSLTMELFDEEGYGMAGSNAMNLTAGRNYKAINVNSLNDGKYIMRLRDAEGKELVQNFAVAKQ